MLTTINLKLHIYCDNFFVKASKSYKIFIKTFCGLRPTIVTTFEVQQDGFHDSSIPPRKCVKSSESVPKPEKVWIIAFFCSKNDFFWCAKQFFFVCRKNFFEGAVQTFAALWREFEFCHVLVPSTIKQSAVQMSVAFSRGKVCVCRSLF